LHFNDGVGDVGSRQMNITIEGTRVLSSYDIVAEAGGKNKAVVEEFNVTVSDGNGMTIALGEGTGSDAFVAGIEISGSNGSVEPPDTVQVLSPAEGENYDIGEVMHIRWRTNETIVNDVQLEITIDGGITFFPVYPEASIDNSMSEWGDFAWTVPQTMSTEGQTVDLAGKTAVVRVIEYSGSRQDLSGPFTIGGTGVTVPAEHLAGIRRLVTVAGRAGGGPLQISVNHSGEHRLRLLNARGSTVATRTGKGTTRHRLDISTLSTGVYLVRVDGIWGHATNTLILSR
jgi:hypothetical protein